MRFEEERFEGGVSVDSTSAADLPVKTTLLP